MIVCERSISEAVDFVCPYRVGNECEKECKIILNGEEMEEVNDFKYLGSVMCKHGDTEGETRERALQGRKGVGSLGHIMKGRSVSMEVKRDLRNTVIVPTLKYTSKTWVWNESQRSRVQAVETSYLRSACGVSRMDGMSSENVYESFGMCYVGKGKKCGALVAMVAFSCYQILVYRSKFQQSTLLSDSVIQSPCLPSALALTSCTFTLSDANCCRNAMI